MLDAARAAARPPRFLFASSLDVYGETQHLPPPRRVGDPVQRHGHLHRPQDRLRAPGRASRASRLHPPLRRRAAHRRARPAPMMFRVPLAHAHRDDPPRGRRPRGGARAVDPGGRGAAPSTSAAGARCQLLYRDYLGAFLDAMGIGRLPDEAFSTEPYCTDWLDTDESQRLLEYQRRTSTTSCARPPRSSAGGTPWPAAPAGPLCARRCCCSRPRGAPAPADRRAPVRV